MTKKLRNIYNLWLSYLIYGEKSIIDQNQILSKTDIIYKSW